MSDTTNADHAPTVALASAIAEAVAEGVDTWLDEVRVRLNVRARRDCCATYLKPCPTHDAYDDGICDLIEVIQGAQIDTHSGGLVKNAE